MRVMNFTLPANSSKVIPFDLNRTVFNVSVQLTVKDDPKYSVTYTNDPTLSLVNDATTNNWITTLPNVPELTDETTGQYYSFTTPVSGLRITTGDDAGTVIVSIIQQGV